MPSSHSLQGRTEDSVKLRWKTLNPNQRTYTKLGRPRLLPTDQIDHPELGFSSSAGTYLSSSSDTNNSAYTPEPATVPSPPSSSETSSNQFVDEVAAYDVKAEGVSVAAAAAAAGALPEPILRRDDSDEEMSSEDIVIFKAFLRGQSSGSMKLDGSFRNLLAEVPETVAKNYPSLAGLSGGASSARSLQRGSSISWAPIEATGGDARPRNKQLVTMMSLGSVRSASLRSLTENDPYFGDDLNRQLSGMSLIEGLAGDADDGGDNQGEVAGARGEYIAKMNSFEEAQLIAETMLPPVQVPKRSTFTEQLNSASVAVGGSQQINEELLHEFLQFPDGTGTGTGSGASASGPGSLATTMSVQDFYNGDVALDLLASADRFEI